MTRRKHEVVEVRAFRGTRRSAACRDMTLAVSDLARMARTAGRDGLECLAGLGGGEPRELGKDEAKRLADETSVLRMTGELPDLDADLTALAELARWCSRSATDARVTIRRRDR